LGLTSSRVTHNVVVSPGHDLLVEVARLEKQLAAVAMIGSTREVVRLLDRLHEARAQQLEQAKA